MSTVAESTWAETVGHESRRDTTASNGVNNQDNYEIFVSLLPAGGPPKSLSSDSTSSQILFNTQVDRIYTTTSAKSSSSSTLPRQIMVESRRSKFGIPADDSFGTESLSKKMVSRLNIPFPLEKNIYWRSLPSSWIKVEGSAELNSHIVRTVGRIMTGMKRGHEGKNVEVKLVLNIAKKIRVGEAEYQQICRAQQEGHAMDDLEKFLIKCQDHHAASTTSRGGGGFERMSVDELKHVAEEHVMRVNSGVLISASDRVSIIDAVARRASREWGRALVSKLSNALVKVETSPTPSSGGECSICLAPKANSVVRLPSCVHTFHRDCLLQWLIHHTPNCPLCRSSPLPSFYRP
ncbi:unnamed protein product [Linum trigynum]|uniref:RING-type domain-containing protein n=1 Tax=Linum trigynum TaxID=586398 RepID=A0AAV2G6J5_9ROSI